MKASFALAQQVSIRVLSPRMEPPVTDDEGSMASKTASFLPVVDQPDAQRFDERRFARPRHPEMPTGIALPVLGNSAVSTLLRPLLVIGTRRFDQRDGLGQRTTLTSQHAIDQRLVGSGQTDWRTGASSSFIRV